jgi:hypothetical protein
MPFGTMIDDSARAVAVRDVGASTQAARQAVIVPSRRRLECAFVAEGGGAFW